MLATRIVQGVRHPRRVFYGWWMALVGMVLVAYQDSVGFYGFTVFFKAIVDEFKWSQALAAIAPSLQRLESGLLAPLTGWMVDRLGPRRVLFLGFGASGAGFLLLSGVQSLWQYYAVFVLIAFGLSAGPFLVASAVMSNWFHRYRGRAIAIVLMGPGLSGILAGTWAWVIPLFGWRATLAVAALGFWAVCVPLALLMRDRPEPYGLQPDGDVPGATTGDPPTRRPGIAEAVYPMRTILRSAGYWLYVLSFASLGASFAVVTFAALALRSYGFSAGVIGLWLTWLTLSSIPSRLIGGVLADLIDKRLVLAGSALVQLAGVLLFAVTASLWTAFLAAFLMGSSFGVNNPARLSLQAEYWGRTVFGRLAGIQMGVSAIPGVLAPIFVGWMFDTTASYRLAFLLLALPVVGAVPLTLLIRRPREASRAGSLVES